MADAAVFQRQPLGLDNLIREQAAERDFGRGHQAQIAIGHAINLRLRPAGDVAGSLQDFVSRQVGRNRRRELFRDQQLEGISLQRQFQQHGVVEQEIKAMAGDLGAPFEIEQLQPLAQRDVIQRFEVELRQRGLSLAQLRGSIDRRPPSVRRDARGWESSAGSHPIPCRCASSSACAAVVCSRSSPP